MSNWRDRISFTLTLKHTVYLFYVIKMGPSKLSIMHKEAAGCLSSHGLRKSAETGGKAMALTPVVESATFSLFSAFN